MPLLAFIVLLAAAIVFAIETFLTRSLIAAGLTLLTVGIILVSTITSGTRVTF